MKKRLHGELVGVSVLSRKQTASMFDLMAEFYDDTDSATFSKDLNEKDLCILLSDNDGTIRGFSTQIFLSVRIGKDMVHGVFSGDTIIHKDYWGSLELFRIFARQVVPYGARYHDFYWFLTSKGYKTYRMLPVFFQDFYPNYRKPTPAYEKSIMHAFGRSKYPLEYDETCGVVVYDRRKDRLKAGIADVDSIRQQDKDINFFVEKNPGYQNGNDLVCLASLAESNFRERARKLLFRNECL